MPETTPVTPVTVATGAGTLVAEVASLVKSYHAFEIVPLFDPISGDEAGEVAVVPSGKTLVNVKPFMDEYLPKPERRDGTAKLRDAASFVDHTKRFASIESVVFANPDPRAPSFLSVLDYHPASSNPKDTDWCMHRALYECPLSDEWKAWTGKNGAAFGQADFAQFIEDRVSDVIDTGPDGDGDLKTFAQLVGGRFAGPSELIGLSRGLQVNAVTNVKNAVTLATGEISVVYDEQHQDGAGQPFKIANLFAIAIPVFYAGDKYLIPVRLRYRISNRSLAWSYHLVRADKVFDDAFKGARATIAAGTGLPVFMGAPES